MVEAPVGWWRGRRHQRFIKNSLMLRRD